MATHESKLVIKTVGADKAKKDFEGVAKSANKAEKETKELDAANKNLGSSFSKLGGIMAGVFAAGAIVNFSKKAVQAWDIQEKAVADVRAAVESTGMAAGRTVEQLTKQASELQKTSLFGDEEILKGATANLLTFTNIAGENFDATQQAVLDLSARMGTDLKSSAIQLGKALNDPVANLSALSRSGIQFNDVQKETIKGLAQSGRLAEAQGIILEELQSQFGGAAKAAAEAGLGPLQQLQMRFGDITEKIGGLVAKLVFALMPAINGVVDAISDLTNWITENLRYIKLFAQLIGIAAAAWGAYILVTNAAAIAQAALNAVMLANPIPIIIVAVAGLITWMVKLYETNEKVRGTFKGIWEAIKQVGTNIKNIVKNTFMPFIEAWQAIKDGRIGDAALSLGKGAFNVATVTSQASKVFEGVGGAFSRGFTEGVNDIRQKKNVEAAASASALGAANPIPNSNTSSIPTQGGINVGSASSSAGKVSGTKQTTLNINVGNLVEELKIETTNLQEGAAEVKDKMVEVLLQVLNESDRLAKV